MARWRWLLIWYCLVAGPVLCGLGLAGYVDVLHWRFPVTDRLCWVVKISEGTLVWLQYHGDEKISVERVTRTTWPTYEIRSTDNEDERLALVFLVPESRYRRARRQPGSFSWQAYSRPGLRTVRASVPMWLPGGLLLFGPVVMVVRQKRRQERMAAGACGECGYLLTGLVEARCPECGTAFEPAGE